MWSPAPTRCNRHIFSPLTSHSPRTTIKSIMWPKLAPKRVFSRKRLFAALSLAVLMALLLPALLGCAAKTTTSLALTVLTEEAPPMNYTENGQVTGLATDVVRGIMNRLGVGYHIQCKPWSEGYDMVQKQANVALFATARTAARENLFQWVGPIAAHQWVFFSRSNSGLNITSLDDAKKVGSIAVYKDDARAQYLTEQGFTNLVTVADVKACLMKLVSGEADLAAASNLGGFLAAQSAGLDPGSLKIAHIFNTVDLYIAFQKDTPKEVVQTWQRALDAMKADGAVSAIALHWQAQLQN
jgi:polar amino acid transport system substrate-binding protein